MSDGLSTVQQRIADFTATHDLTAPIQARALDLASEVGELAKEVNKCTGYGREPFREPPAGWQDELGDVFFAVICLANSTGVDLEVALEGVLHKYSGRLEGRDEAGSGR